MPGNRSTRDDPFARGHSLLLLPRGGAIKTLLAPRLRGHAKCPPNLPASRRKEEALNSYLNSPMQKRSGAPRKRTLPLRIVKLAWSGKRGSKTLHSCEFLSNSDDLSASEPSLSANIRVTALMCFEWRSGSDVIRPIHSSRFRYRRAQL